MSKSIPAVAAAPVLGNVRQFARDRLGLFMHVMRTCGDVGAYHIGRRRFVLVNSPAIAHQVLVERAADFDKTPHFRRFAAPVLGNGLLTSPNAFHACQRPLLAPAFQSHHVGAHAEVIAGYAERMAGRWSDGEVVNIQQEMVRLTLWIVGKTLFDADVLSEADELGAALTDAIHGFNAQVSAFVPLTIEWPTPTNLRYRRAVRRVNRTVKALIAERCASGRDHGDLLTMLLRARYADGSPMSQEQIRDEAMTMFMPGHETSATALTWCWHLLSQHPAVYQRLLDEVDRELGGERPTVGDAPRLSYTLQVFKEAMRLYPPVYMFTRQAVRDVEIDAYRFPAGSFLMFSPYSMHRRSEHFPDPERFDPDRFAPESEQRLPPQAYIPFGAGRRICIGNHYAMLSGQLILATIAQRVRFSCGQAAVGMEPMVTLRPDRPIQMKVNVRSARAARAASGLGRTPPSAAGTGCPFHGRSAEVQLSN
jgi:cytochrome P450